MKNLASIFKPYTILAAKAQTATASGAGVNVMGAGVGPAYDAVAIANIGLVTGAPSAVSCVITVEASATSGGTYTTIGTFATIATVVATAEAGAIPIILDPTKPFVRATATMTLTGGSSPAIPIGVTLAVRQSVATDSNNTALA